MDTTSPGVMTSCTAFQWYWVSWRNGIVAIGSGEQVGANVLNVYNDPVTSTTGTITNLGVSTTSNVTGTWIFPGCYYGPGTLELVTIGN